ncbi:hypothetical protein ACHQM5_018878 [Ranunculus cassubicifolius]
MDGKHWKQQNVRKDRKSGTGMSGSPKKGGHGGKFTWAGDGLAGVEIGEKDMILDEKDPNYEDPVVEGGAKKTN